MDKKEIIGKVKQFTWEPWLRRPFNPFIMSIFADSDAEAFAKIHLPKFHFRAMLFQHGAWFESPEVWKEMGDSLEKPLKDYSIIRLSKDLESFKKKSEAEILNLIKQKGSILKRLEKVHQILRIG